MSYTDFNWKGECFLIADDDNFCHLLLEKVLKKTGADVIHAYDGVEAVDLLLKNKNVSIAIVDMIMPGYDGLEVIEQTKMHCPDVCFFSYTADIYRVSEKDCIQKGYTKCFSKPMLPVRLFTEIYEAVKLKKFINT